MCDAHFGRKWEFMSRVLLPVSLHYTDNADPLILFAVQGKYTDAAHHIWVQNCSAPNTSHPQTEITEHSFASNNSTLEYCRYHFGVKRGTELPASTAASWDWSETGLTSQHSAHWKSPKFGGFDCTICELLYLRLREKFITDWEDWRHSRNLAIYPPPK